MGPDTPSAHRRTIAAAAAIALALTLTLSAGIVAAKITGYKSYDVGGKTLDDVWKDIEKKGFPEGGNVYAGEANVSVGSPNVLPTESCKEIAMSECERGFGWACSLSIKPKWNIKTEITLPNWPGAADTCDEAKTEWQRFLDALKKHEDGHDTISENALANAKPPAAATLTSATFQHCDRGEALRLASEDLDAKYKAELARLKDIVDKANKDYDATTGHGATQGATLDTSIVCPPTAKEQLEDLRSELDFLDDKGLIKALGKKLDAAIASIEKENTEAAEKQIDAFIKHVKAQRGKKLDADVADYLVEQAEAAKQAL